MFVCTSGREVKESTKEETITVCTEALGVRSGSGTERRQREKWYPRGASTLLPLLLGMGAELGWAVGTDSSLLQRLESLPAKCPEALPAPAWPRPAAPKPGMGG